jgi:hypothetical protein
MFDPDANLPRPNRALIYMGAIAESVDLAHEIFYRVFRKVLAKMSEGGWRMEKRGQELAAINLEMNFAVLLAPSKRSLRSRWKRMCGCRCLLA